MYAEALVASQHELSPAGAERDWAAVVAERMAATATRAAAGAASSFLTRAVLGLETVLEAVEGRRKAARRAKRLRHRAYLAAQLGVGGANNETPRLLRPLQHSGYRDESSDDGGARARSTSQPPPSPSSPLLAAWLLKAVTPPLNQAARSSVPPRTLSLGSGAARPRLPIVAEVSSFLTGRVRVAWAAPSARVGWPAGAFEVRAWVQSLCGGPLCLSLSRSFALSRFLLPPALPILHP
jgi:hypothetical protein